MDLIDEIQFPGVPHRKYLTLNKVHVFEGVPQRLLLLDFNRGLEVLKLRFYIVNVVDARGKTSQYCLKMNLLKIRLNKTNLSCFKDKVGLN